jgi:hypothetical protein
VVQTAPKALPLWFPSVQCQVFLKGGNKQLFMSGKDAGATMHFHSAAYNILFFGYKRWILLPPRYTEISGMPVSHYIRDTEARGIHKYECMQQPGDLVLLPRYWGHATINPFGFATGLGNLYLDAKTEATVVAHHQKEDGPADAPPWATARNLGEAPLKTKAGKKHERLDFHDAMRPMVPEQHVHNAPPPEQGQKVETKYNPALTFLPPSAPLAQTNHLEVSTERSGVCARQIAFVHINKAGGTAMLEDLQSCCNSRLLSSKENKKENKGSKNKFNKKKPSRKSNFFFHANADRQRQLVGDEAWNDAFKFALVRNPWARQVSMFHFLVGGHCKSQLRPATDEVTNGEPHYLYAGESRGGLACSTRFLPSGQGDWLDDNTKAIPAFQKWMARLNEAFPTGHPANYLFGSMAHGNDETPWFNASQLSWLVDRSGLVLVDQVIKLEELADKWSQLTNDLCAPETLDKSHVRDF